MNTSSTQKTNPISKKPWLPWVVAVLFCCLIPIRLAPLIVQNPSNFIFGNWRHPDCLGNHWLLVWVAERLSNGEGILKNDWYYYPYGDAPWLAGNGSEGFLYLPFHVIFGWPTGAGIFLILILWWNGFSGYLLGRAVGAGPWLSLLTAGCSGYSVYALQEMSSGRFSQADIGWFIGAMASFIWLLRSPNTKRAVLCGAAVAMASMLYWYYGVFFILIALFLVSFRLIFRQQIPWREVGLAATISILLATPMLWVYMSNWELIPGTTDEPFPRNTGNLDSIALTLPFMIRVYGEHMGQATAIPVLILAIWALARAIKGTSDDRALDIGLVVICLVFWVFALGPQGKLYVWFYGLAEPLQRFWWPYRHILVSSIAVGALAARGLTSLPGPKPILGLLAGFSVPFALYLQHDPTTIPFSSITNPGVFYSEVSKIPGKALLQVPFSPQVSATQNGLLYQIYHQKRTINGHAPWVKRVRPPEWDRWIQQNSFLQGLAQYERGKLSGDWEFKAEDLQELLDLGVNIIVIDPELFPIILNPLVTGYRDLFQQLLGDPILTHEGAVAFRLDQWDGKTSLDVYGWTWPKGLNPGGNDRPLMSPLPDNSILRARRQ